MRSPDETHRHWSVPKRSERSWFLIGWIGIFDVLSPIWSKAHPAPRRDDSRENDTASLSRNAKAPSRGVSSVVCRHLKGGNATEWRLKACSFRLSELKNYLQVNDSTGKYLESLRYLCAHRSCYKGREGSSPLLWRNSFRKVLDDEFQLVSIVSFPNTEIKDCKIEIAIQRYIIRSCNESFIHLSLVDPVYLSLA